MTLAVLSAFRNSASRGHLAPYFRQLRALEKSLPSPLTCVWAEGDSIDHTLDALRVEASERHANAQRRTILVDVTHGEREFGSTEEPARLAVLSRLLNTTLDAIPKDVSAVVWVESDLRWRPGTLLRLLIHLSTVDIVAPMTFAEPSIFYDLWGVRLLDDRRIAPFAPYLPPEYLADHRLDGGPLVEMGSVGSCVALRGRVAHTVRIQHGGAIVDWCAAARAASHRVWLDTEVSVQHPYANMPVEAL